VVAASTPDENERIWGAENLPGVQIYSDYDEMLEKADLEAVVVASVTAVHAEQALKAIEKGYHVLCEKPLSIDVEVVSLSRYCFLRLSLRLIISPEV
jgi:myo-inositol 2-dehydrogenase/D-chiro-inositol 1-dehydrogenase